MGPRREEKGIGPVRPATDPVRHPEVHARGASGPVRHPAALTLYLALTLPVILSLLLALIEGSRIGAVRLEAECAADVSADAVLSEFHRELLHGYDLLMLDEGYGSSDYGRHRVEERLDYYLRQNFGGDIPLYRTHSFTAMETEDVRVLRLRRATDDNGEPLRQQIYAYMTADPVEAVAGEVLQLVDQFEGLGILTSEWSDRRKANEEALRQAEEAAKERRRQEWEAWEAAVAENRTDEVEEPPPEESLERPDSAVGSFRATPILWQIFGDKDKVSDKEIDLSAQCSHRALAEGDWGADDSGRPAATSVMLDSYILEKCGRFTKPTKEHPLNYEVEYILCGKGSDKENLEGVAGRILLIREAANALYLFTDETKKGEAEFMAMAISFVLANPELEPLLQGAILFAWAYLESVKDVRALLEGKKVPLIKTAETWKTGLSGIFAPEEAVSSAPESVGLGYDAYLHVLLYLMRIEARTMRLADVMEMTIRGLDKNENFRMDHCLDTLELDLFFKSRFGYRHRVRLRAGY